MFSALSMSLLCYIYAIPEMSKHQIMSRLACHISQYVRLACHWLRLISQIFRMNMSGKYHPLKIHRFLTLWPRKKWRTLCRRHLKCIFLQRNFNWDCIESLFQRFDWQQISIWSGNSSPKAVMIFHWQLNAHHTIRVDVITIKLTFWRGICYHLRPWSVIRIFAYFINTLVHI